MIPATEDILKWNPGDAIKVYIDANLFDGKSLPEEIGEQNASGGYRPI